MLSAPPEVSGLGDRRISVLDFLLVSAAILALLFVLLAAMFGALALAGLYQKKITLGVAVGANAISVIAVLLPVQLIVLRRKGMDWRGFGFHPVTPRAIMLSIAVAVALIMAAALARTAFGIWDDRDMVRLVAPEGFGVASLIVMVALIGVLMPFTEEIYFRGVLYRWLRGRLPPTAAIPVSAAIFAVSHLQYVPVLMIMVAVLGCVFAYGYERSGSLWVPFAMHAANNSLGVVLIYASIA